MMSIASYYHQRDVLSRNPVVGYHVFRYGSDNWTNAFSSSNSVVFIHFSVRLGTPSFHHQYLSLTYLPGSYQLRMLPISPVSFAAAQYYRSHSVQWARLSHVIQPSSDVSCHSIIIPSTSHLSKPCRSVQLFIRSIRNTTISIHIDSTSSVSDLKHFIYVCDGIPPCDQRLMLRGRELRDDALLSGLGVDGATITCLLRVLGGTPKKPKTHKLAIHWWFGFSRSYEDGRTGEEGRICHVLSEIEFEGPCPRNWYSDLPLSNWEGIELHSGIVLIDCHNICRFDNNFSD